ncbi:MAG: hypothetical protein GVY16_10630 [Planctomycetes bacterium]|jgi:hypothetical protein|nr:hypothetical protein [Planctomycetota bacterium]
MKAELMMLRHTPTNSRLTAAIAPATIRVPMRRFGGGGDALAGGDVVSLRDVCKSWSDMLGFYGLPARSASALVDEEASVYDPHAKNTSKGFDHGEHIGMHACHGHPPPRLTARHDRRQ